MKVSTRILITAIAGGLTYLLTNVTGQPEIWQLTMSVFVGGIVLVVQILIDYDNRMLQFAAQQAHHVRRTEEIVDRRFAAISAATALYARVEATALKADNVTRLVESAARVGPHDALSRRFADHQINRLSTLFEGLQNGLAVDDGEDPNWLLGLTECTSQSIDATSMTSFARPAGYVDDDEFWSSRLGQRYLDGQRRAIADRGVRIRRVFLLSDKDAEDEERLQALREPHRRIGIETRVLRQSGLDFLLQTNLVDFILFDRAASYELHSSSTLGSENRPAIVSVTLVVEPRRLAERRQRFESMWEAARDE